MKRYFLLFFALLSSCSIFQKDKDDLPPYSTIVYEGEKGSHIYVWTYSQLLINGAPMYGNVMLNKGASISLDNGMKVSRQGNHLFVNGQRIKEDGRNTNIYLTSDGRIEYNAFISTFY